jgi:hypothetical protein
LYPNGEFGMGYKAKEKKAIREKRYDEGIVDGVEYREMPRENELSTGEKYYDGGDTVLTPFKLDSPHESSQTKKYGLRGITSLGKKMVRNGTFLIEGRLKRPGDCPQFSTLTIPQLPPEYEKYICTNWANLVRRLFQECKRKYAKYGRAFHYTSVTEIQPNRWYKKGFVGLHLHFVYNAFWVKDEKCWAIVDDWMRRTWCGIINTTLEKASTELGTPPPQFSWVSYRREPIKKSAESYIGKYMSKGGGFIADIIEKKGEEYLPSQWWSTSSYLRILIKRLTMRSLCEHTCNKIIQCIHAQDKRIIYAIPIIKEVPYCTHAGESGTGEFLLGYAGRITQSLLKECKDLWRGIKKSLTTGDELARVLDSF